MTDTIGSAAREIPSLDDYRATARAWLTENFPLRPDDEAPRRGPYDTTQIPAQRALQKKVFEAGYTGITWPVEYGGQGLPVAYEAAFIEESEHFKMPDLGPMAGT